MSTRVDSDARQTHIDIHQDRQLVPSPSPVGCVSRCFDAVREQALNAIFTDRCFGKFEIETARKLGGPIYTRSIRFGPNHEASHGTRNHAFARTQR